MPTTFASSINSNPIYAARAEADAAGNTISSTYAAKSEVPTIGTIDLTPVSPTPEPETETCPNCEGSGVEPGQEAGTTCGECGGTGILNNWVPCGTCEGTGMVDGDTCQDCGGAGGTTEEISCATCGGTGVRQEPMTCGMCGGSGTIYVGE